MRRLLSLLLVLCSGQMDYTDPSAAQVHIPIRPQTDGTPHQAPPRPEQRHLRNSDVATVSEGVR
jgi:hypothetical protein